MVAFLLVFFAAQLVPAAFDCDGCIEADIVYGDTEIEHARITKTVATTVIISSSGFSPLPIPVPNTEAGENGISVSINNHALLIFPMGRRGLNMLYVYDTTSKNWGKIYVHCPPLGVALQVRNLVGFCVVNTSILCVPYFKLTLQDDGSWSDDLGSGLCSYKLSTGNLTNPVILQHESQYGYVVKLYFAERGTNRLYEINLSEQESNYYDVPNYGEHELKITRLVSAVADNGSFTGLRIESSTSNSADVYHKWFSSTASSFSSKVIQTDTVSFNSRNLKYLVTFTANHKTMIVIYPEDGRTRPYLLDSTLNDPIHCKNMIGPVSHYLFCLTKENGPILINVKAGTSYTISISSNVTNIGELTNATLYLLTTEQEMIIVPILTPHRLVSLTVRNDDIRVMNGIQCDHNSSTQKDNDNAPVLPIVLPLFTFIVIVIVLVLLSLCLYKKYNYIIDALLQYFNYHILDTTEDESGTQDADGVVTTEAKQCSDKSVSMPEPRLRLPADGRASADER